MAKRKRHSMQRRRRIVIVTLLIVLFVVLCGPILWSIGRLKQAKDDYDVLGVSSELHRLESYDWLLDRVGFIKDAKLWLALNLDDRDLTIELSGYQDDKHWFWLFLYDLQKGDISGAQSVLAKMGKTTRGQLGQGLVELSQGNAKEAKKLLVETTLDWKSLSRQELTLRYLTLAHADLDLDDLPSAHTELAEAKHLDPANPAALTTEFDLAMKEEQWTKAYELSHAIQAQTWRPKSSLFETQKALLALRLDNKKDLADCLSVLENLTQGESLINYVKGVQALMKGNVQEGKSLLQNALKEGLEGQSKSDALVALDQINKRQNVDPILKSLSTEP